MLSNLVTDLRFALRSALRQPVFTVIVILKLALGIGANTAMFATIHTALLKPLPFKDPERLVFASCTFAGLPNPMASAPDFYDYHEQADNFEALCAILSLAPKTTVTGATTPERVAFTFVSDDLFRSLGVTPAAGLLLAKGSARRSELAVRAALGASRARLVRQLLAESMVLSLLAGVAGLAVAFWLGRLLPRTLFPGRSPLGRRVMVDIGGPQPLLCDVAGVVGDARIDAIGLPAPMTMYVSYHQVPQATLRFALRTDQDPESTARAVRRLVAARDPNIPVERLVSMERLIADSLTPQRVTAATPSLFSAVALLLACIGLYGVLAYYVNQRTHEIGIRMSLGADQRTIMRHVLTRSGMLVLPGLGLGIAGSLVGRRLIEGLLYSVAPNDPATFGIVSACFAAVAFAASALPASIPSARSGTSRPDWTETNCSSLD